MEKFKKCLFTILISLTVLAILSDVLYLCLRLFGEEKTVVYTLEGGTLKNVDDTNKKYIFNFRYFKNEDNSGIECFEFLTNYFIDEQIESGENDEKVYSFGVQLINPNFISEELDIEFSLLDDARLVETYFSPFYTYDMYDGKAHVRNFYNPEKFVKNDVISECRAIDDEKYMLINLDDDVYRMSFNKYILASDFKNCPILYEFTNPLSWLIGRDPCYLHNNFAYFLGKMFTSIKDFSLGENQTTLLDLYDCFKFEKFDKEQKVYVPLSKDSKDTELLGSLKLVTDYVKEYFAVKIDCYDYGMTKSSESLFGCVFGNYTYNTTNQDNTTDYFLGEGVLHLTERNFEFRFEEGKGYYPVLKNSVKLELEKYEDVKFQVTFNMNFLSQCGVEKLNIYKSKLNIGDLEIKEIVKNYYDSGGELLNTEVENVE